MGGLLSTWCITILSGADSFRLWFYSHRSWTAFIPVRMLFTRRLWNYWNLTPRTGQTDFFTKQMACAVGVWKDIKGEGDSAREKRELLARLSSFARGLVPNFRPSSFRTPALRQPCRNLTAYLRNLFCLMLLEGQVLGFPSPRRPSNVLGYAMFYCNPCG